MNRFGSSVLRIFSRPGVPCIPWLQFRIWVAFLAACINFSLAAETLKTKAEQQGEELAKEARSQVPTENSEHTAKLILRPDVGNRSEVPIRLQVIAGNPIWEAIYESTAPGKPNQKLVIRHYPSGTNQFLLAEPEPGRTVLGELKPVDGDALYKSFAGSDFSLLDLGMEFLHWPTQRYLTNEMTSSIACRTLESLNPTPTLHGYSRVKSWLDVKYGQIVKAEAYDRGGKLLKRFSIKEFKKLNGKWELQGVEIRSTFTDRVTRLDYEPSKDALKPPP